ncbi:MAG: hypothetical protein ACXW29_09145 [Thermoanaerobaculia bacterium]
MSPMELLPGITEAGCPPSVVCDSRDSIRRARTRALARDIAQVMLLFGVDYLFLHWPSTHLPLTGRHQSLMLLGTVNGASLAWLWLSRAMPRWTARRIASTWSSTERRRFERF